MGDPRLGEPRRWGVFWIHHEAEELRVHHRATIPADAARALVVTLLASGRVPPLQATLLGLGDAAVQPVLHRFWGTACRCGEAVYLILFIKSAVSCWPCRDKRRREASDQLTGTRTRGACPRRRG